MIKITFLTLLCVLSLKATMACKAKGPIRMSVAISTEDSSRFFFNGKSVFKDKPEITVDQCLPTANAQKFVMVAMAIDNFVLTNKTGSHSLNDDLSTRGDRCRIENNPFSNQTPEERKEKLFERREVLNHCATIQVTDFSSAGIQYPEEQVGCDVMPVSENSVNMKGAFCYFSPTAESQYSVHLEIDEKCYDTSYLAYNKIALQDINGLLNTYIAGDASGRSSDLTATSVTDVRFSINPLKSIMGISESYGESRPVWPSVWSIGNVELGNIRIQKGYSESADLIQVPFIVDNRCKRSCNNQGLCSSSCDYTQPVVGRYNLYERVNGKFEYLKTWYDGSVAPAQYQGFLYGSGYEIPNNFLAEGKTFMVEVEFDEPDLAFAHFDGRIKESLRLRQNQLPEISREGFVNEIPVFSLIDNINKIPGFDPIDNGVMFNSLGLSRDFQENLRRLNNYLDTSFWPPYFDKLCDTATGRCKKIGDAKVKLAMTFSLTEEDDEYEVENVRISRRGNLGKNYGFKSQPKYKINCRRQRD